MKNKLDQIIFLDKILLPIFGIQSICDYQSKISLHSIKLAPDFLDKLNGVLTQLKEVYPVREFNLHKSDNLIKTYQQAFGLVKKCLQLSNIPFEIINEKNLTYVRLISKNIILEDYIEKQKMSEIRKESQMFQIGQSNQINLSPIPKDLLAKNSLNYSDLLKGIKKETTKEFICPLNRISKIFTKERGIEISSSYHDYLLENLGSLSVKFVAKKKDGEMILGGQSFINKLFQRSTYKLHLGPTELDLKDNNFEQGKNLLPDNIIFPFIANSYTKLHLFIYPNPDYDINDFIEGIDIIITINQIEFTKKTNNKLENWVKPLDLKIPHKGKSNNYWIHFKEGWIEYKPQDPDNGQANSNFEDKGEEKGIEKDILPPKSLIESLSMKGVYGDEYQLEFMGKIPNKKVKITEDILKYHLTELVNLDIENKKDLKYFQVSHYDEEQIRERTMVYGQSNLFKNEGSGRLLAILIEGYDIASSVFHTSLNQIQYYYKEKDKYIFRYRFLRTGDTISDIKLFFPKKIIGLPEVYLLKSDYSSASSRKFIPEEEQLLNLFDYGDGFFLITDFTMEKQLSLISHPMSITLEIRLDHRNQMDTLLENTKISYELYMYNNNIRSILIGKNPPIVQFTKI